MKTDNELTDDQIAALKCIKEGAKKTGNDIISYMKKSGASSGTINKILANNEIYNKMFKMEKPKEIFSYNYFKISKLKELITTGNKGIFRLLISFSLIWLLGTLIILKPYVPSYKQSNITEYIFIGILPIVVFWSILWVIKGFVVSSKNKNLDSTTKK